LLFFVIPANPGSVPGEAPETRNFNSLSWSWTPVSTEVTIFHETNKIDELPKVMNETAQQKDPDARRANL
jgi:hypothetical protein